MKLAFQLVTWNSAAWLPYLFASLKDQTLLTTLPKTAWKLFVFDNGSTDKSVEYVETFSQEFSLELIQHKENIGFAAGHNALFQKHDAEYVVLLNPDIVLLPKTLERMVQAFSTLPKETAAITPRLMRAHPANDVAFRSVDTVDSLGLRVHRSRRVTEIGGGESWKGLEGSFAKEAVPVFGVSGALPMYRRSALQDVAFSSGDIFDPLHGSYKEDVDLAFRLVSRGYEACAIPSIVAYHGRGIAGGRGYGASLALSKGKESSFARLLSYRNHWYTILKNEYTENLRLDFFALLWYELTKFGWHLLFAPRVLAQTVHDLWLNWAKLMKNRAEIQEKRRLSASEVRSWWK